MALLAASSSLSCLSLRCAHPSTPAPTGTHLSRIAAASPTCAAPPVTTPAVLPSGRFNVELGGSALAGALFAALASSDSAMATQEMMNLAAAADDNRGLGLLLTLVPAVGWVLFNILQPALNQLDRMKSAKGLAVGLGMGAATSLLVHPPHADAAVQEIASLAADNDSRGLLLLIVLVPAVGWVLFNILKPALNQLDRMNSAKGVLGAVGLSSALLLCASQADAATVQEITSLADGASSDARGLLLLGVLAPAVGWVLFNILKPGLSQLDKMKATKGIFGAAGLSGALLSLTPQADAAVQEVSRLADSLEPAGSDARSLLLLAALVPALGWVLFNILQPALNQFDRMKASKGIAAAVGLGAASALLPLQADALQELATVADNDSRGTLVLFVLIPAIGWVLFNILQPALNQFDKMKAQK